MTEARMRSVALALAVAGAIGSILTCEPSAQGQTFRPGSAQIIPRAALHELSADRFATEDGHTIWSVRLPGDHPLATPAVEGDRIYVGGGFGSHEMYAFDARSGRAIWGSRVSDDGPTAALVGDENIIFNTESCTLFILDKRTGEHRWSRYLGDPLLSQPAYAEGRVVSAYPAEGGHHVVALDIRDGSVLWDAAIDGEIVTAPVIVGTEVLLTTYAGTLFALDLEHGQRRWRRAGERVTSAPFVDGGRLWVSVRVDRGGESAREGVQAFDVRTGRPVLPAPVAVRDAPYLDHAVQESTRLATQQHSQNAGVGFGTPPAAAQADLAEALIGQGNVMGMWGYEGSRPVLASFDGSTTLYNAMGDVVQALDPADGRARWTRPMTIAGSMRRLGGALVTAPAITRGGIVVGTSSGALVAMDPRTGATTWSLMVDQPIREQPAVHEGWIYIGTGSGNLVAVDTGHPELTGWPMWGRSATHL